MTYDGQGRLQPDLTFTSAFGKAELLMNVDGVGPPRFEQVVTKWPQAGQYEQPVWPNTRLAMRIDERPSYLDTVEKVGDSRSIPLFIDR
ncbi:hypothetical protein GNZ12_26005 [Paraburkholderia sp. 1N]|uniref:Uncharacterized protein n=1 Tax=Paraburkholderia solitsugae TaxID=2675748 RepID=A0ABX2BV11_9BURK|nr:hypothetical protein [Paraburkholderia solitsugae]